MISGTKFMEARLRLGLTVKELAGLAKVAAGTIRRLEYGQTDRLADKTILALATIFGVDPVAFRHAIMTGKDIPQAAEKEKGRGHGRHAAAN